ncbi:hypothetical protein F0562_003855 [Nyssa sinensis]|uniref:Uncharacterized protein n=1 Tax=Nyssa sinensis TaxID=561372 RepID=A0A5J5C1G9_9ASTE|nr:hypothetical protein F0562_003855 [Nyssa sinensis]
MSERDEDKDSDAPEEFTLEQGVEQDEEIRKVQRENKARVVREGKERRRQWAQKKTPRPSRGDESIQNVIETETHKESQESSGMLPSDIVELLAAREKHIFSSDSEEEKTAKKPTKKKRPKYFWARTCYFRGHSGRSMLTELLGVFEEKENAGFKIIGSFEQPQPSIAPPFYIWRVK